MHTGTDFAQTYVLEDTTSNSEKELNGFSACAQMRRYETSSVAAVFSLNFKKGGRIEMSMDRTVTSTLKPGASKVSTLCGIQWGGTIWGVPPFC